MFARLFRGAGGDRAGALVPARGSEPGLHAACGAVSLFVVPRFSTLSNRSASRRRLRFAGWGASGRLTEYWWMAGPIALAVLAFAWARSGTAARFQSASWNWLKLFPWMRSILANYEAANFSRVARPAARAPGDLSRGTGAGGRLDRQPADDARSACARRGNRSRPGRTGSAQARSNRTRSCRCYAGFWRQGRTKVRFAWRCETSPGTTASAASSWLRSSRCFCRRSSWSCIGASATLFYALALFLPIVKL